MENLSKACEREEELKVKIGNPRTFAEQFLEEPIPEEQIRGNSKTMYFSRSIPIPMPTYCYWRKLPVMDDADWLE